MCKSLGSKYGQKLLDSTKKLVSQAFKTALKRTIQKPAEVTGDEKLQKRLHRLQRLSVKLQANRQRLQKLMKS